MQGAVAALPREEQRAIMVWLGQQGPFWDDDRQHDGEDWYECAGEIVTDTAIGEAAHCHLHGIERGLMSFDPSNFMYDPVPVERVVADDNRVRVDIRNYWEPAAVEKCLAAASPALDSWDALGQLSVSRFDGLRFAANAFEPLRSQPFQHGIAERIQARLDVLNRLAQCFGQNGSRTADGHALYHQHFTGNKSWFSDSSDTEKIDFKNELTFPHPDAPSESLFCGWHGKIKSPQYRIHFSWPITAVSPVFVVYVGPKITRR